VVGEYLLELRSDEVNKLCSSNNLLNIKFSQGIISGIDSYLELENELDKYKLQTEAKAEQMEALKFRSVTSQAEAMGII
jgi:nucleoside phosphorylase